MIKSQPSHLHKPDTLLLLVFGVGVAFLITLGIHSHQIKDQQTELISTTVVSQPNVSTTVALKGY